MYSEMGKFWFWAHKVLPLVYDDSLSYYEVLCKVVAKLNECIDKINELGNELDEFEGWTREEFQKVRDEMAAEIQRVEGVISDLDSKVDREVGRLDGRVDALGTDLGNRISAVMSNFCGAWVAGSSYQVGAIVRYGDTVYECNTANEDTEFTPTHWTAKTIKSVIDDVNTALESEIGGVIQMVAETREMLAPEYSVTGTYYRTQYVRYAGRLYKARTDIPYPAGDWDSSEWMLAPLSDQILRNYNYAKHCYDALNIPSYSENEHYSVNDVVTHYYNDSDAIWVCKDADVTGTWDDSKWDFFAYVEGSYKELIEKLYLTISNMNTNFATVGLFESAIKGSIATDYDETATYNTGDYCFDDYTHLYMCLEDNVTGTWDVSKWRLAVITDELKSLLGRFGGLTLRKITQSDYDALVAGGTVDANTLYLIY